MTDDALNKIIEDIAKIACVHQGEEVFPPYDFDPQLAEDMERIMRRNEE